MYTNGIEFIALGLALLGVSCIPLCAAKPEPNPGQVRSTYVLGADDQISIHALQAEEISDKPVRIDPNGFVNLPMIGRLKAADLTIEQFEQQLTKRLETFYIHPEVAVTITEFRSQPVTVVGSVNNPGVHQLQGHKTVLEVISLAGGVRADAGPVLKITRLSEWGPIGLPNTRQEADGKFTVGEIDLKSLFDASNPLENIPVSPNDVLSVPKAEIVYVVGEVKKSGGFVLSSHSNVSVIEALAMAEGFKPDAAPAGAKILRARTDGEMVRRETPVNMKTILAGKTTDITLGPEDILFVPSSITKSATLRAIEVAIQIGTGVAIFHR